MTFSKSLISLDRFLNQGEDFTRDFPVSRFAFPGRGMKWRENPRSQCGRIGNDVLFQLKISPPEKKHGLLEEIHTFSAENSKRLPPAEWDRLLANPDSPFYAQELDWTPENQEENSRGGAGFLHGLRVLCVCLYLDSLQRSAARDAKDWDRPAKELKKQSAQKLKSLEAVLPDQFHPPPIPDAFLPISKQAAEEEVFFHAIEYHLKKAESHGRDLEQQALIIEKIRPPMGIVTHTSPALLRPCSYLLMDARIDAASGIPYNAALILSILQDIRCTQICLSALEKYPPRHTKIRENLIYTLGVLAADQTVPHLIESLKQPDQYSSPPDDIKGQVGLLREQKEEAIHALGRIGEASLKALPALCPYTEHSSAVLQTTLAWTLGELGRAQKKRYGGVSADILISMLKLLQSKHKQVFEEAVAALKKIDMPEFIHALYLYNVGAVNILGLKPAQRGLYELSETLHFLIRTKGQAVIAVNGDSGTGKTYFCHALLKGFAGISSREILYLMRDRPQDQKTFNRMLGIKWLRKYIEPSYYQGYPFSEDEDDPESFFMQFFSGHSGKKLIILDGCRDRYYFQRVIDLFYFHGRLDCEVNFRATHSTRRRNLEEREIALESVKNHLSFLEEPALEDTHFYREGFLFLYDLDNSLNSRLSREEIHELFGKSRIDEWGDLIRLGRFTEPGKSLVSSMPFLSSQQKEIHCRSGRFPGSQIQAFSADERRFTPVLNPRLAEDPNFLLSVEMDDLKPKTLRFYALEQIAGTGTGGEVFILSFIDNRIFYIQTRQHPEHDPILLGRDVFLISSRGEIQRISFESRETEIFSPLHSPVCSGAVYKRDMIITGHRDGTVAVWDFQKRKYHIHQSHSAAVRSLSADHYGYIFSWGEDEILTRWHPEQSGGTVFPLPSSRIPRLLMGPRNRLISLTFGPSQTSILKIFDFSKRREHNLEVPGNQPVNQAAVDQQGRIIAALGSKSRGTSGTLAVMNPSLASPEYHMLAGHSHETLGCMVMGPKILTCGREKSGRFSLRIWGTPYFVQREHAKFSLQKL